MNVIIFIMHVRKLRNGCYANELKAVFILKCTTTDPELLYRVHVTTYNLLIAEILISQSAVLCHKELFNIYRSNFCGRYTSYNHPRDFEATRSCSRYTIMSIVAGLQIRVRN